MVAGGSSPRGARRASWEPAHPSTGLASRFVKLSKPTQNVLTRARSSQYSTDSVGWILAFVPTHRARELCHPRRPGAANSGSSSSGASSSPGASQSVPRSENFVSRLMSRSRTIRSHVRGVRAVQPRSFCARLIAQRRECRNSVRCVARAVQARWSRPSPSRSLTPVASANPHEDRPSLAFSREHPCRFSSRGASARAPR